VESALRSNPCSHLVYLQAYRENSDKPRGGEKRSSLSSAEVDIVSVGGCFTFKAASPS